MAAASIRSILDRTAHLARTGNLSIFCGAGISKPGGLPLASQLVSAILEWTSLSTDQKAWISNVVPRQLPFERLMETVLDTMAEHPRREFLEVFRLGSPGIAHGFLGEAAKKGFLRAICSTNFDLHVETSLEGSGLRRDEDYVVHHRPERFSSIVWSAKPLPLIKIHGSVESPDEMAITVQRVATQGRDQDTQNVITQLFGAGSEHGMLVLGYSFSDRFDLTPAMQLVSRQTPQSWVLVVDHGEGARQDTATLIPIGQAASQVQSSNIVEALGANPNVWILNADTAWVLQELSARLELDLSEQPRAEPEWIEYLQKFALRLNSGSNELMPDSLAGSLLEMIGAHSEAIPYLQRTVERAKLSRLQQVQLVACQNLIGALAGAERLEEAWRLLAETEPLARSFGGGAHADHMLSQFGSLYKQIAEACIERSREYFEEAIRISSNEGGGMRAVPHLAGAAAAWMRLGDMDAAYSRYMQSYEIVRRSGDPTREAEVCGNIASLFYIVQDYSNALEWYGKALQLSELTGDQRNQGIHWMNRANVLVKQEKHAEALAAYRAARQLLDKTDPLLALLDRHEAMARQRKEAAGLTPT